MVDINTSTSALQAQLQASQQQQVRPNARPIGGASANSNASPQDVVSRRVEARQDIPTPDRRAPAKQTSSSNQLSSSQEIEDAGQRVATLTGNTREAPVGRLSNNSGVERDQPLGQIVNILV